MAGGNGQGRDDTFFADVLRGIGAPVNAGTLSVLRALALKESGPPSKNNMDSASWNPFNTTIPGPPGTTKFNSIPVRNYPSRAAGVDATVRTLKQGYYKNVVKALQRSSPEAAIAALVASPWSGSNYGARKLRGGGYDYVHTSIFALWKSVGGKAAQAPVTTITAAGPLRLPAGLTSGSGQSGTIIYDPLANAIIGADGTIYAPFTQWLKAVDAPTRRNTRIVMKPGEVKRIQGIAGAGKDPGGTREEGLTIPGFGLVGAGVEAAGGAADALIGGPWAWIGGHLSAIGIGALAVLCIIVGITFNNMGTIKQLAGTAVTTLPKA